jgi:hypothetical protein
MGTAVFLVCERVMTQSLNSQKEGEEEENKKKKREEEEVSSLIFFKVNLEPS